MSFWQQFELQLVSPILGTALIGGVATWVARRYQNRQLDRKVRLDLLARLSNIAYAIHTKLSFYERWLRHSHPSAEDRDLRRTELDRDFIAQRVLLGALQTEVDAYYGKSSDAGRQLHRLTDLTMLRYGLILEIPTTQLTELIEHVGQPDHSGFSVEDLARLMQAPRPTDTKIWRPVQETETRFTASLRDTMDALLNIEPISAVAGFRSAELHFQSSKMLTAHDQPDPRASPGSEQAAN